MFVLKYSDKLRVCMAEYLNKGEIVIYTSKDGHVNLNARLENETIWLTQDMIVKLFDSSKANISEHISHIFKEHELDKDSTIRKFRTVRKEGNRNVSRELEYYNLDIIIAVGYRVNSKKATQFRIWATNVLRDYLTKGYVVNVKQLQNQKEKFETLKTTVSLLSRSLANQIESIDEAQNVAKLLENFALGLELLDDFDHKTLDNKGQTSKKAVRISTDEFLNVVNKMKSEFASDVFANPKDNSFESSVNQIYQTFGSEDCYPTLEKKPQCFCT